MLFVRHLAPSVGVPSPISDQLRHQLAAAEPRVEDHAVAEMKARILDMERRLGGLTPATAAGKTPSTKPRRSSAEESNLGLFGPQPDLPIS